MKSADIKNLLSTMLTCGSLLIRFNQSKFFPWNINKTDGNDVNKQNTHTHVKHLER